MPIMGGLEATTLIRDHEDKNSRSHTPIIALTAHAMIGDKERCLAAGVSSILRMKRIYNTMLIYLDG